MLLETPLKKSRYADYIANNPYVNNV